MNGLLISLSGGLDSAVLLGYEVGSDQPRWDSIQTVSFHYGSKHNRYEQEAAEKIARHYKVSWQAISLTNVFSNFKSNLLLNGGDIPEGHYTDQSMKLTVVPARNLIFLSVLAGLADSLGLDTIAIATHSGDHHIYPDCRPEFIDVMSQTILKATEGRVSLQAPFSHKTKADLVRLGEDINVPFHLTRTCYKAQPIACGKCGSCVERLEAFRLNGMKDPIPYWE